ncbi:hypothetical protein FQN60_009924 [Etheostoma spectabile]|uniref:Uncharacterized protein n=1 Tax=Etheostoma spectabile TaxID=54343 RepID=A0A5J5D540_9PERO|nr:hypothetical protein FQN60_009924 [Etheostoma spectabile]
MHRLECGLNHFFFIIKQSSSLRGHILLAFPVKSLTAKSEVNCPEKLRVIWGFTANYLPLPFEASNMHDEAWGNFNVNIQTLPYLELNNENILAEWERRIGVWLRGTTAFKHDETGSEAAARASSPGQLTVCIQASIEAAFTMHVSP